MTNNIQYILYLRKSTDDGTHQKLSLPAQEFETREYAESNHFPIFELITDSKSARLPGRPGFNDMLKRIEFGYEFPVGIICWSVDRISRNPTDDAMIKSLLDTGKLADIQFRSFRFENNATGRFLLDIQFAQSRYHINSHSEGLKRTMREKLRRGQFPGRKFFGWRYNHHIRNIEPHPVQGPLILALFEEFSKGTLSLRSAILFLSKLCAEHGIRRSTSIYGMNYILRNPIYTGIIRWKGEIVEGKFEPILPTSIFRKVQEVLDNGKRIHKIRRHHGFPFCGIFRCTCGSMVTAQFAKRGRYTYYRCTRKLGVNCTERYVRAEALHDQLLARLKPISLPTGWVIALSSKVDEMAKASRSQTLLRHTALTQKLDSVQEKLKRLLDLQLERPLDAETALAHHDTLVRAKMDLKSQLRECERATSDYWLEPMRHAIRTLSKATELLIDRNLVETSAIVRTIGTNHRISNGLTHFELVPPYDSVASVLAEIAIDLQAPQPVDTPVSPQCLQLCTR